MHASWRYPTAVDLFSGAGGLSLGLKWAGFKVLGAVELDGTARETYMANHPDVRLVGGDIRELSGRALMSQLGLHRGELGLLAGCPPCQGYSSLRTRNGSRTKRDRRNELVNEMGRVVDEVFPGAVMLENVPGLLGTHRFRKLVNELSELGYDSEWRVLDAADYGVPQRRKRLVLLASRLSEPLFPEPAGGSVTVRDAIASLLPAGGSGDPLHDVPERRTPKVKAIIAAIPKDGGSRKSLPTKLTLSCHQKRDGFFDVYGRMSWDQASPTITSGCTNPSKGRFLHPVEDRAITLREAALLQSFPSTYFFSLRRGKEDAARQIGNAFPPVMIKQLAAPGNLGL